MILSIDIETYSSRDLTKCGAYAYVEADDFDVLLFGYAFDDEPVQVVDLARGERLPTRVLEALFDPNVVKTAYNAQFERASLARFLGRPMPAEQWDCTMARALYAGLPGSLEQAALALGLDVQKDPAGTRLISLFSKPDSEGRRRRPEDDLERWERFKAYCRRDVEVERAMRKVLPPLPPAERDLWIIDQEINAKGIMVDMELVEGAIRISEEYSGRLLDKARKLTGLENPNSVEQLKGWLESEGMVVNSLDRETVDQLLETAKGTAREVLLIRRELAKSSIKKYQAIQRAVCQDGRVRGLLQYYGASRTGRWAGRLVQIQNLPRNTMPGLDTARELVKSGSMETLNMLYDSVSDVLSQLIRTAFIPEPGKRFFISDFSAIEARVVAWLAGEHWRLDVFRTHGKIYEASASQMFGVPIEQITKDSPLRQKGKVAELALGYQGGVGALVSMGALSMGLKEEELGDLVLAWRQANPAIVRFWRTIEEAAFRAIQNGKTYLIGKGLKVGCGGNQLIITLPSGRQLFYHKPRIERDERYDKLTITYMGTELGKWTRLKTYGGKLTENVVQAIARDCLAEAIKRLHKAGYKIVLHVHDEVGAEMEVGDIREMEKIMSEPLEWGEDLPLAADGFVTNYYRKD